MRLSDSSGAGKLAGRSAFLAAGLLAATMLCGCVAVGYSSSGGWFIWPGGLGLLLVILFVVFLLRRR